MSSITFTDQSTIVPAAWLNDVDALVYGSSGNLGLDNVIIGATTPLAGSFTTVVASTNVTAGTLVAAAGSITDSSGAITFGNENLSTTGTLSSGALTVTSMVSGGDIISDTDSTDSLGSTGVRWLKAWVDSLTAGTLTLGAGSIVDSSGAISFGDENLVTTGTFGCGALTAAAISGTTGTFTDNVSLGDSNHIYLGTGNDVDIYHDGTQTRQINNTGNFSIQEKVNSGLIQLLANNSAGTLKTCATFGEATPNVKLYYDGTVVASTQSGGIAFNADTAAANTLDDYEEGFFTVTLTSASGTVTLKSDQDKLAYTKIGRKVFVNGSIGVTSISTPSGALTCNGLPFTSASTSELAHRVGFYIYYRGLAGGATLGLVGQINNAGTTFTILDQTTTSTGDAGALMANTTFLYFDFSYYV